MQLNYLNIPISEMEINESFIFKDLYFFSFEYL